MKSEPLHNEILVTKIKSVYDCEKHIKIMNTKPQTSNLLTNRNKKGIPTQLYYYLKPYSWLSATIEQ